MSAIGVYVRSLRPGLPRDVYILQVGLVVNAFGNGAGNPFIVLYLHNVRDIPLAVAGLAGATSAACALLAAAAAGSVADRRGARGTMIGGLIISVVGWGLYPLVREPWQAIALATLTGSGIGVWLTLQSTVLALIVPQRLRHAAFAQQRVAANLGLGLGGLAGGLIVTTAKPATFTLLFLLNAATFAVYSLFIARLQLPARPQRSGRDGGYRRVLRDRAFVRLLALNFAFVISSVALINSMFPVFARNQGRPLVADLAPEGTTARYMAASGLAWQSGFIAAPAVGGTILGAQPLALWPLIAAVALAAGAYSLRFESSLAPATRWTPRREPPPVQAQPAEATP